MKKRTTIYIDRELLKEAKLIMKEKDRSLSSYISELIREIIKKKNKRRVAI